MIEKKVSIIIPIYNGARFLEDTIKSILKQTYNNIELVLVDDGSQDTTLDICKQYEKIDDRVRVIHKENGGMSSARAVGYESIDKDNWILFFDADDIPAPNMIEVLLKYSDSDMVLSCFDDEVNSNILEKPFDVHALRIVKGDGKYFLDYLEDNNEAVGRMGNLCGVLLNPSFFIKEYEKLSMKKDSYPQNYLNDAYSIPRLIYDANDVTFSNNNVYHHRLSKYTDSRLLKPNSLAYELLEVQKDNLNFYKDNASKNAYEGRFLGYMLVILKLWYQVVMHEDDKDKAQTYRRKIETDFGEKWSEFRNIVYKNPMRKMAKYTVGLFAISPTLWMCVVGHIRYGILYRLK